MTRLVARSLGIAILFAFVAFAPAQSFCGLHFCPRVDPDEAGGWQTGLRTRWVSFDLDGRSGRYLTTSPRLLWGAGAFTLGAEVPLTRLRTAGETRTGLSNPLLTAQYNAGFSRAWSWEAGLQLELPLGDSNKKIADDHAMVLPWIGARRHLAGPWFASATAGYSRALESGGGHDHGTGETSARTGAAARVAHDGHLHGDGAAPGGEPVLVNPHGDRELHARAAIGHGMGRTVLEGYAMGQFDVSGGGDPAAYLRAGAAWELPLSRATTVRLQADAPVTANRRADVEIAIGVMTGL